MCELLVGLGDVDLVGVDDSGEGTLLGVVIRLRKPRPSCGACGGRVWSKGYRTVVLVDLPGVRSASAAEVAETPLDVPESRFCGPLAH